MYFAYGEDRNHPTNSLQAFEFAVAKALVKLENSIYGCKDARVELVDCYAHPALNPPKLPNILSR